MAEQTNIKCVVVGSHSIGKTCLLISYTVGSYPSEYIPTVFDNYSKILTVDDKTFQIGLWDTSGATGWERLRPLSYPQTDIFLVCFAVNNRSSFKDLTRKDVDVGGHKGWLGETHYHVPKAPFLLIGLKDDLRNNVSLFWSNITTERMNKIIYGYMTHEIITIIPLDVLGIIEEYLKEDMDTSKFVTDEEAELLCQSMGGYKYMTCSSLEMTGLDEIFEQVCRCYETVPTTTTTCSGCILL